MQENLSPEHCNVKFSEDIKRYPLAPNSDAEYFPGAKIIVSPSEATTRALSTVHTFVVASTQDAAAPPPGAAYQGPAAEQARGIKINNIAASFFIIYNSRCN